MLARRPGSWSDVNTPVSLRKAASALVCGATSIIHGCPPRAVCGVARRARRVLPSPRLMSGAPGLTRRRGGPPWHGRSVPSRRSRSGRHGRSRCTPVRTVFARRRWWPGCRLFCCGELVYGRCPASRWCLLLFLEFGYPGGDDRAFRVADRVDAVEMALFGSVYVDQQVDLG